MEKKTMTVCRMTKLEFEQSAGELAVCRALDVPEPSILPAKRLQHRLSFRNERTLYKRTSSLSGKPIISIYAPEARYPIFSPEEWWSDAWEGLDYGRDYDFRRPFFEQFAELQRQVPRIALFNVNPFNSDYCQQAYNNKNCYLCTVVKDCEDSMYISHSNRVRDSFDCDYVQNVELCYDCLDSERLYSCIGCENCQNSHDLHFCIDCIGCSNCIGCWGLRNQRYHVANTKVSKEEYERLLSSLQLNKNSSYQSKSEQLRQAAYSGSNRLVYNINVTDCIGNHLINAKNCEHCYDAYEIEECANCTWIFESHHCAGIYGMGTSEWVYESVGVEKLNCGAFNTFVSDSGYAYYSDLSFYCRDIFGCAGLKRKQYCILNRQYSPDEYQTLRAAIIEHMQRTGEWGQFFPPALSPFAYNETVAQERFPLTKEQAENAGYGWRELEMKDYQPQKLALPDDSGEAGDELTKAILACAKTKKNYRITPQELAFYKKMNLPVPRLCPDARYQARMERRDR